MSDLPEVEDITRITYRPDDDSGNPALAGLRATTTRDV